MSEDANVTQQAGFAEGAEGAPATPGEQREVGVAAAVERGPAELTDGTDDDVPRTGTGAPGQLPHNDADEARSDDDPGPGGR